MEALKNYLLEYFADTQYAAIVDALIKIIEFIATL